MFLFAVMGSFVPFISSWSFGDQFSLLGTSGCPGTYCVEGMTSDLPHGLPTVETPGGCLLNCREQNIDLVSGQSWSEPLHYGPADTLRAVGENTPKTTSVMVPWHGWHSVARVIILVVFILWPSWFTAFLLRQQLHSKVTCPGFCQILLSHSLDTSSFSFKAFTAKYNCVLILCF